MTTTLHITLESTDEFFAAAMTDLREVSGGTAASDEYVLSLPDESALERVLSAKNLELLRTIATEDPESVRALARLVDRDVKNVSTALDRLADIGLVTLESAGRAKRPVVHYDEIEVSLDISGVEDGGSTAPA